MRSRENWTSAIRTSVVLAFGGTDLETWADPLFHDLPAGPAVLLSFGAVEYGGRQMVEKLRSAGLERLSRVQRPVRVVEAGLAAQFNEISVVSALMGAGFVYLQGGNPRTIVSELANTDFWSQVLEQRLPVIATSGSSMALGTRCPDMAPGKTGWVDGLNLVPDALLAAHWDSFHAKDPQFRASFESEAGSRRLFAIEDKVALRLNGGEQAHGEGTVQVLQEGIWRKVAATT